MQNLKTSWNSWQQHQNLVPKEFVCGYCANKVGSTVGYINGSDPANQLIYICTNCGLPTLFFNGEQYPGSVLGRNVESLPNDVAQIYEEIRDSIKCKSYTAAVLLSRKLIMHLSVNIAGAKEGLSFVEYVNYLGEARFIPPNGNEILDYIRKLGNEKNHELKIGTNEESVKILKFIEILLIFMYEFPLELKGGNN